MLYPAYCFIYGHSKDGTWRMSVCRQHSLDEYWAGNHGVGNVNSNGFRLPVPVLNLCSELGLVITNTCSNKETNTRLHGCTQNPSSSTYESNRSTYSCRNFPQFLILSSHLPSTKFVSPRRDSRTVKPGALLGFLPKLK